MFMQDEQDMDEHEELQEQQMKDTNQALIKMKSIMETIEPILFDIQDGTLKRVAESNFKRGERRMKLDDETENQRTTAMFNDEESALPKHQTMAKHEVEDEEAKEAWKNLEHNSSNRIVIAASESSGVSSKERNELCLEEKTESVSEA